MSILYMGSPQVPAHRKGNNDFLLMTLQFAGTIGFLPQTSFVRPKWSLDPLTAHMRDTELFRLAWKFMRKHGLDGALPSVASCLSGDKASVKIIFLLNFPPNKPGGMEMNYARGMAGRSDGSGQLYEPCLRMLVALVSSCPPTIDSISSKQNLRI